MFMKDNFSIQSDQYLKFRPTYPNELYDFILALVKTKNTAWDCGTGNGQVAAELSKHFTKVYATDISEKQIKSAIRKDNIFYKVECAERTSFRENTFDLITVAQAVHWFNFNDFYHEVKRTINPNGIIAVIGYGLIETDKEANQIISHFYKTILGKFWDKERKYIDENYQTIPFPFNEIESPILFNNFEWTFEQLTGYFETWSAVRHYIKAKKENPIDLIQKDLKETWKTELLKTVRFPILLRIGRVENTSNR